MTHYHGILIFGILGIICTGIAMYFTFKANLGSSAKSTRIEGHASRTEGIAIDINQKNEELLKKNSELKNEVDELRLENLTLHRELKNETKIINDNITGGDSYPLLDISIDNKTKVSSYYLQVRGSNNLNNVKFSSLNISDVQNFHESNPNIYGHDTRMTMAMFKDDKIEFEKMKQKAYTSKTKLKDGSFSVKSSEYIGNQIFDFVYSGNFGITGILIEAPNGKYYQIFNWGNFDIDYHKYPPYFVNIETILFDENGKVLYQSVYKKEYFSPQTEKFTSIGKIDFTTIKEYFEEKKKMNF